MSEHVDLLFEEFAARHARGEQPDARDYLARAGEDRGELASLLDAYVAAAPVQPPSPATLGLFETWVAEDAETPPLLAERVRRGWRRQEVVAWICERFAIAEAKEEKVARYWHEVETGLRPLAGVSTRLRDALRERFGDAVDAASVWRRPPVDDAVAYLRLPGPLFERLASLEELRSSPVAEPARDEVDELFQADQDVSASDDR